MVLLGDGLLKPCEKEEIVDFTSLFRALCRWRKLFVIGLALFWVGGGLLMWLLPERYAAQAVFEIGRFEKRKKEGGWIIQKGLSIGGFKSREAMLHDLNAFAQRLANESAFSGEERETLQSGLKGGFDRFFVPYTNLFRLVEINDVNTNKAWVYGFQLKAIARTTQSALGFVEFWADYLRSRFLFFAIKDYVLLGHDHLVGGNKERATVAAAFFDQFKEKLTQTQGDGILLFSVLKEMYTNQFGGSDEGRSAAERYVGEALSVDIRHFQDLFYGVFDYLSTPVVRSLNPPGVRGLQLLGLVGLSFLFWVMVVVVVNWGWRNGLWIRR